MLSDLFWQLCATEKQGININAKVPIIRETTVSFLLLISVISFLI